MSTVSCDRKASANRFLVLWSPSPYHQSTLPTTSPIAPGQSSSLSLPLPLSHLHSVSVAGTFYTHPAAVLETSLRVVQADPDHKSGFGIEAPTGVLLARSVQTQMTLLLSQYNEAVRTIDDIKVRMQLLGLIGGGWGMVGGDGGGGVWSGWLNAWWVWESARCHSQGGGPVKWWGRGVEGHCPVTTVSCIVCSCSSAWLPALHAGQDRPREAKPRGV